MTSIFYFPTEFQFRVSTLTTVNQHHTEHVQYLETIFFSLYKTQHRLWHRVFHCSLTQREKGNKT